MTTKYPNKAHVAYATLLSMDPGVTIGGVKIGSEFYKVCINHVVAKDEPLVRPCLGATILVMLKPKESELLGLRCLYVQTGFLTLNQ